MHLGDAMPQKSEPSPSAQTAGAVKPQGSRLRVEAPTVERRPPGQSPGSVKATPYSRNASWANGARAFRWFSQAEFRRPAGMG